MMETNFMMLQKLIKDFEPSHKGWLSGEECDYVSSTLHLEEMDILALRNLRDFTVMFLTDKVRDNRKVERKIDYMDICSGITAVIDRRIFDLGGVV